MISHNKEHRGQDLEQEKLTDCQGGRHTYTYIHARTYWGSRVAENRRQ